MKSPNVQPAPDIRQTARLIRERIEADGERVWRFEDFADQPVMAVAQTLSRLTKTGIIQRLSKGVYYRARETTFGKSRPNPISLQKLAENKKSLFPSGISAANLLGFSTQTAKRAEVSTNASSLPRKLLGKETIIHTRRPDSWSSLTATEAAILDFLRRGGADSELGPQATIEKMLSLLSKKPCYSRLVSVAPTEPPRVRAILGAIGQQMKADKPLLASLRASLNPLSRFDFGLFSSLPYANNWQAKKVLKNETL